jgi:hypothetical protein
METTQDASLQPMRRMQTRMGSSCVSIFPPCIHVSDAVLDHPIDLVPLGVYFELMIGDLGKLCLRSSLQIGNCVSLSQSKPFLRLLSLTPLAINISSIPVLYPAFKHFRAALRLAFNDPWIRENWWNWKWSWVVYGGPVGRYVAGIVYGYRALQRKLGHHAPSQLGDCVKEPRLALAGTLLFALFLGVFSVVSS